jgi:AmiR/NasT family two-component response regulator
MHNTAAQQPTVLGRRSLGNAEGVLITLRHCSADEAFDELVAAANRRRVPLFRLACAVVQLAAEGTLTKDEPCQAAQAEWPGLLGLGR